jgi:hypothetical protein
MTPPSRSAIRETVQTEIEFDQGEYRYLKVTWDDSASARIPLPGSVSARLISAGSLQPRLKTSIPFERRASEPGVSRYRLRMPAARLPITEIQLSACGGNILRQARITEARFSGSEIVPRVLGAATLRREIRGELAAAEMSIPIASPQETRIELTIEDGNNPPLEITEISAFFAYLPWIYFESADDKPNGTLRICGSAGTRYDLEAAQSQPRKFRFPEAHGVRRANQTGGGESGNNGLASAGSSICGKFRYAAALSQEIRLSSFPWMLPSWRIANWMICALQDQTEIKFPISWRKWMSSF